MNALVLFRLADREFALDVSCVREVIRMVALTPLPPLAGLSPEVLGAMIVRGESVLVMDLGRRFNLPSQPPTPNSPLILVKAGSLSFAALVDQVTSIIHADVSPGGLFHVEDRLVSQLDPQQLPSDSMMSLLTKLDVPSSGG